jgi:UDP-N-acetylmuramate: L-alanyl-gamma-D-glutamyl-meso-diaminopimelate ligase
MWRKVHFIGIGGVGMSAVAKLLKDEGVVVTGSDEGVYPPISDFLAREGLGVRTPYAAENIPPDADLIVIGKNARLVPETNTEVAAAYASGKTILSFPEVLAELSREKETIVVAGSYGKSTSTALLAHCLESAGLEPSYFIGASPLTPQTSARLRGKLFILEGDEYPSSNTDLRAKFLHYHPSHLLIMPLAHDHFNIFKTPTDYLKPFEELLTLPPKDATVVVCTEGPLNKALLSAIKRPVVTYGLTTGDFQASGISWGETTSFSIMKGGEKIVEVETTQLGEHNVQNIVGVAAFVFSRQLMKPVQFAEAVASFKGIRRRLDRKSSNTSIPIFEGFGSSFEKMSAAMAAMKRHFPARRLMVVFEPNTIGWRTRASLPQYDGVFEGAAQVFIFEPPHDGKATEVTGEEIAARVTHSGVDARACSTPEAVLETLVKELQKDDVVLLSSSGGMGGLIDSIPALAEQRFPA